MSTTEKENTADSQKSFQFPFELNKDRLALVVGGMAIIALVFATYNFFNKDANITSTKTEREDSLDFKNEFKTSNEGTTKETNPKNTNNAMEAITDSGITTMEQTAIVWTANDYKSGDIKQGSYTVVKGDTLWEIAEAMYGDGTQWTKILEANKSSIGYLPNGSQALIVPGQVLSFP